MIKVILWDIDGTLLNFKIAEKVAFFACCKDLGIQNTTEEMLGRYSAINHIYWQKLERNEITKKEVLEGRFIEFFTKEMDLVKEKKSTLLLPQNGKTIEEIAVAFNAEYQKKLGDTSVYNPYGKEIVEACQRKYKQYIVTNGTSTAQHRKLKNSGLEHMVDGWFISDEIGIEKPNIGFFDAVWAKIGFYKKEEVLIVGDSLTSDIRGGNNAGILTCWYNPDGLPNLQKEPVAYEITDLKQIEDILEKEERL